MAYIDTDAISEKYRSAAVRPSERMLLVSILEGTEQESDISEPVNCEGVGRIRHFRRETSSRWVANPLPIDPAAHALGLGPVGEMRAQVFQNAVCNWRCWYCFVPFALLGGDPRFSAWKTADELVDLFVELDDRPTILDLSGGQPDLVPEWVPWTMEALRDRGLFGNVYLWSDDNLGNDYFWTRLSTQQISAVADYPTYGRVCCFKGIDADSFSFNTGASPSLYPRQFELFSRLLGLGINLFAYVTLTTPNNKQLASRVRRFADRLQQIHPNLPLRTVPLEVQVFSPVTRRLNESRREAIENQYLALEAWNSELERRFSPAEREQSIAEVTVGPLNVG